MNSAPSAQNETTLAELTLQLEEAQATMDGARMGEIEAKIKALELKEKAKQEEGAPQQPSIAEIVKEGDPVKLAELDDRFAVAQSVKESSVIESSPVKKDFGELMSEFEDAEKKRTNAFYSSIGDADPNVLSTEAEYKVAGDRLKEWAKENNVDDLNSAMDDHQVGELEKSIPSIQISDADLVKKVKSMQGQGVGKMEKKYEDGDSVLVDSKAVMNSSLSNEEKLGLLTSISSSVEGGVLGTKASKVLNNYKKSLSETKE